MRGFEVIVLSDVWSLSQGNNILYSSSTILMSEVSNIDTYMSVSAMSGKDHLGY